MTMSAPSELHLKHLIDVAKYLQPIDDALSHMISHKAARQAVQLTGSASSLRNFLCPRCHHTLRDVDKLPEEERCPTCFVEFTRRAKQNVKKQRKRRRIDVSAQPGDEGGCMDLNNLPAETDSEGDRSDDEESIAAGYPASSKDTVASQSAASEAVLITSKVSSKLATTLVCSSSSSGSIVSSEKSAAAKRRDRQAASKDAFSAVVAAEASKGALSANSAAASPVASGLSTVPRAPATGDAGSQSLRGLFDSWGDILGSSAKPAAVSSSEVLSVSMRSGSVALPTGSKPAGLAGVVTTGPDARDTAASSFLGTDMLATGKAAKRAAAEKAKLKGPGQGVSQPAPRTLLNRSEQSPLDSGSVSKSGAILSTGAGLLGLLDGGLSCAPALPPAAPKPSSVVAATGPPAKQPFSFGAGKQGNGGGAAAKKPFSFGKR